MTHVVEAGHPLASQSAISFAELERHRRLTFSAHVNKLPTAEYLRAAQTWRAENYMALLEMVRAGMGWATVPRQLVQNSLSRGALVELSLAAYPHTDWHVGVDLLWSKKTRFNRVEQWLKSSFEAQPISDAIEGQRINPGVSS